MPFPVRPTHCQQLQVIPIALLRLYTAKVLPFIFYNLAPLWLTKILLISGLGRIEEGVRPIYGERHVWVDHV